MSSYKDKQAETDRIKANAAMIRANKQQAEFEASQGGGGFFRPEASMQMASLNSGIMPGTTGGIGGAGAVVAPVDFGSPSGIQSQFAHRQAVPAGGAGIEATMYEPLTDLHSMSKEIENEYHQGVVDINSLSQMFYDCGCIELHIRICSPELKYPCYYGIDIPTKEELIINNYTIPQIEKKCNLTSLRYISLESMIQSFNNDTEFCTACFSGNYNKELDW